MGENRFQPIDPSLTEEKMLADEAAVYENHSPVDSAAQLFQMYSPQYRNLVKRMPRNALVRLAVALVEGMLSDDGFKPTTKQEEAAYVIGDKLLQARWVMQLHTLNEHAKELEAFRASQAAPEGSIPLSDLQSKFDSVTLDKQTLIGDNKNE